ncbi:MAG: hypothetical protein AB3A66_07590 [Nodularia sp. CChRGM 3473]
MDVYILVSINFGNLGAIACNAITHCPEGKLPQTVQKPITKNF